MTKTLHATFDGKVFRPDRSIRLKRNTSYIITIERQEKLSNKQDSWDILSNSVGKIEGPSDWSKENHFAFGIWADRLSEGNSAEIAENLRNKIGSRN